MKYKSVNIKSKNKAKIIKEIITASDIKKVYKGNIIDQIVGFEKRFNKSFWNDFVMFRYISDKITESEIVLGYSQSGVKYNYYDDDLKHVFILLLIGNDCKAPVELVTYYKKLLSDEEVISYIIARKGENVFEDRFRFRPETIKK